MCKNANPLVESEEDTDERERTTELHDKTRPTLLIYESTTSSASRHHIDVILMLTVTVFLYFGVRLTCASRRKKGVGNLVSEYK